MPDPLFQSLTATGMHDSRVLPLAFAAGLSSSLGPCVAPRLIAAAGLAAGSDRARAALSVAAFVTGLICAYACFGLIASLLGRAVALTQATYAIVGAALIASGLRALWGERAGCEHHGDSARRYGAGAAFLLGASFAFVVSPCCAPLVIAVVAWTSATGDAALGSAVLGAFAFGHAVPVVAVAAGANGLTNVFGHRDLAAGASVVGASLMLALGAYYAVLA